MASFVDYQQNPLFINILALFSFKIILLIHCLKAFNNTLGWKDPDSKEREDRNIVARAQPPLHMKGRAENKTIIKNIKSTVPLSYSLITCFSVMEI